MSRRRRDALGNMRDPLTKVQYTILTDGMKAAKKLRKDSDDSDTPLFIEGVLLRGICRHRTGGNPTRILKVLCDWGFLRFTRSEDIYTFVQKPHSDHNRVGHEPYAIPSDGIANLVAHYKRGVRSFTIEHLKVGPKKGKNEDTLDADEFQKCLLKRHREGQQHEFSWGDILASHLAVEQLNEGPLTGEQSRTVFAIHCPFTTTPASYRTRMKDLGYLERSKIPSRSQRTQYAWAVTNRTKNALARHGIRSTLPLHHRQRISDMLD